MNEELEKILKKMIVVTKANYPTTNLGDLFIKTLNKYIMDLKTSTIEFKTFCAQFSRKNNFTGTFLRKELIDYVNSHTKNGIDVDIILSYLDILHNYCVKEFYGKNLSHENYETVRQYLIAYSSIVKEPSNSLDKMKNMIYNNPALIQNLSPIAGKIVNIYANSLNLNDILRLDTVQMNQTRKTEKQVLTNSTGSALLNSFSGELLNGKISLESQRGYLRNPNKPQQDAIISVVKDENCYINAIADGVGGSKNGHTASMITVEGLKLWFQSLDISLLQDAENVRYIESLLNKEMIKINNFIKRNYSGSSSTVVVALTMYDKTIIANVGDSTCYGSYFDNMIELSTLDSPSRGMPYTQARHNEYNRFVTNAVGQEELEENREFMHFQVISNVGQRIILSSDGVTDLVQSKKFQSFFQKSNISAKEIVDSAVYKPDVTPGMKNSDNVSAIVVDLPNYQMTTQRKRGM